MKKFLLLALSIFTCNTHAQTITTQEYYELFKNYNACFILFDVNQQKIISEYNPNNRCNERISPNSSFKVPLSLIAFDADVITQDTVFKWDGTKGVMPEHEQDQTPATWLKYSVVWVSQKITPELGYQKIKNYLAKFNYGNQDFSGDAGLNNGLTHAWLSSSLKISSNEQLTFLNNMLQYKLPISKQAINNTEKNMYLGTLDNGFAYYGKTGSGRHGRNERLTNPSKLRDGYFIGFIENGNQRYIFVSNLTDKNPQPETDGSLKPFGGQILKPIVLQILNEYFGK